MKIEIPNNFVKVIRIALHQQYNRIVDDNGMAISCSQDTADTTYEALQFFEELEKDLGEYSKQEEEEKNVSKTEYVETNIGLVPLEDYYDIQAMQMGFNDYYDLLKQGYSLDKPETITLDEKEVEEDGGLDR